MSVESGNEKTTKPTVCVIDYDVGNVGSIVNMLRRVGANTVVSRDRDVILAADKLVLPGVGSFDGGMTNIEAFGLADTLNQAVLGMRKPILGVCLGAQLMTQGSEEGTKPGLGWIPATIVHFKFPSHAKLRVPHMGWNEVRIAHPHAVLRNLPDPARFYFVHSYYMVADDDTWISGRTTYGAEFTSVLAHDNIIAVQFHPEKSHRYGMKLYRNFVEEPVLCSLAA